MKKLSLIAILFSSLILVGCSEPVKTTENLNNNFVEQVTNKEDSENNTKPQEVENSLKNIKIYLQNEQSTELVAEEAEVYTNNLVNVLNVLTESDRTPIPKGTKFLGVEVKDKIAHVNVSKEFINPNSMTSYSSTIKVDAIVNTLCLNKDLGIEGVKFLVEGKEEVVDLSGVANQIYKPTA